MKFSYVPILKSKEAELKGYYFLDENIKNDILPLLELTRSRRSKNNPDGRIEIKFKAIQKSLGESRPFILDITSEASLGNAEITSMLDPDNGFQNWVSFIRSLPKVVVPCIHYVGAIDNDFKKQINDLYSFKDAVCFRVSNFEEEGISATQDFLQIVGERNVILVLDAIYVNKTSKDTVVLNARNFLNTISASLSSNAVVVFAASSFPKSITTDGKIDDERGKCHLLERALYKEVSSASPVKGKKIIYGDYGLIHPIVYDDFGRWIPRIDVVEDSEVFYYRKKIHDGGYVAAAKLVMADPRYRTLSVINLWADNEIAQAASGEPNGKSPSHWISVRLNMHITKQYLFLQYTSLL